MERSAREANSKLLEVRNLSTQFATARGVIRAVDNVSFDLDEGETLGLVGESGCGKSVTALSIVRLITEPPGHIASGEVRFGGTDLLKLSKPDIRRVRGRLIGFIFQDPMMSLNPVLPIGYQVSEAMQVHLGLSKRAATERAVELLSRVGIPRPKDRIDDYPHQFSGGMRQRVMIAAAIACEPRLLLADEPTTALDVTIQAQILELIRSLSNEFGTSVLLITHDMGIAAGMCDRVNVMYAGRIVETGPVDRIFEDSAMPYTSGLLDSLPQPGQDPGGKLRAIEGSPPDLTADTEECRFAPRCRYARAICWRSEPELLPRHDDGHEARCWGTETGGWIGGLIS